MDHQKRYSSSHCSISTTATAQVRQLSHCIKTFTFKLLFLLALTLIFNSCVSHPYIEPEQELVLFPEELYIPETFEWKKLDSDHDIEYLDFENKAFPIIYHAVKINLQDPDLQIEAFPGTPDTPTLFKSERTLEFARKTDCTVAINASPFCGKSGKWDLAAKLGSTRQIVGTHIINGIVFSPPNQRYAALSFTKNETGWNAKVIRSQTEEVLNNCDFAFGGFYVILEDGIEQTFRAANHDSRTAAGLSEDGKYLFILVAEGEFPHQSKGLSFQQCAKIFKKMGCSDALEFDGGGSAQLCLNGKSVLSYPNLRYQANSFGFRY